MIRNINIKIDWTLIFLLALPFFYVAGQDLRAVQQYFFQVAAVVLVGLFHANRYVGLFLLYCAAQFVFLPASDPTVLQNIFFGAIIYQFILKVSDVSEYPKYFKALLIVLGINLVWCVLQYFNIDPIFQMRDQFNQTVITEPSGFWGLPAFLGNFTAAIAPLALSVSWFSIPFILIGIVLSKSSFSVVACGSAIMFFSWFKNRIVFVVLSALIVIGGGFYVLKYDLPSGQFEKRIHAWNLIIKTACQKQIFGRGIGSYQKYILMETFPGNDMIITPSQEVAMSHLAKHVRDHGQPEIADKILNAGGPIDADKLSRLLQKHQIDFKVWNYAHNEFIQAFFDGGIIVLLIIGAFIFDLFRRFWYFGRKNAVCIALCASFVAMLIVSLGHFPFHLARLSGIYVILIAFLDKSLLQQERVKKYVY